MEFQIEHPLMLLFLIPVLISLVLFWHKKKVKRKKEYVIISLRSIIYLFLILGLCMPSLLSPVKGTHTVFLVDQSDSVKRMEGEILSSINEAIKHKKGEDSYSIVTFSEKPKLERSFTDQQETIHQLSVNDGSQFTNIEEGLEFAANYIPENRKGRIVLLSDGIETNGNSTKQSSFYKGRNIEMDAMAFQPPYVEDVSLQSFHTPQTSFEGEAVPFQIGLEANVDTQATLHITQNNETIIKEEVVVAKGSNTYSYSIPLKDPGLYTFKAEIFPKVDKIVENNISHALTQVSGQPKVLMVDQEGEGENVFRALDASGWKIDRIHPSLLPTTLSGFLAYESIIFHNVSGHLLSGNQMELMETAVRDFGVGFTMTGGNESYGLGGYFQTPIEKILPVDMDVKGKKEIPSLGLIIVLDRSGSMMGEKFDLAKEAAARSVELLKEEDTFGFIAFDTEPWQVVETNPIKDKEEVMETIRSTALGGGTDIFPALNQAYQQLNEMDLKRKHIILLTDGQSNNGPYEEIIEEGLTNNVTLSTVAIGGDADTSLLEELAELGTGRFYEVYEASSVPSIISRETALTTKTYIEDNPHVPTVYAGYDWSKRFESGTPFLNTYIATTLKSRAEQIISSEKEDPILARMNYGLGRTIAWTSDVSGAWSGGFPSWEEWTAFWNEMVTWSLPSYEQGAYDISTTVDGGRASVKVEALEDILMPVSISVSNNKGQIIEDAKSKMVGPGQYEVEFPAIPDIYFLNITQEEEGETVSTYSSGMVVPFSTEFEQRPVNLELLKNITANQNGKVLEDTEEVFRPYHRNVYQSQTVWLPFVIVAFFLLIVEIFFRRFGLISLAFWKKGKEKKEKNVSDKRWKAPVIHRKKVKQTEKREEPKKEMKEFKPRKKTPTPPKETKPSEDRMNQLLKAKNRKRK
ncbi:VWA domain-containing protein [Sutcliffiella horikoshii]|uniref:VWA domain-containing protein n=1 Tax=Sutcliffiella horikoshii TaxID=79883 RepID=A0A5D4SK68_9BACI|nr:VWA domain-containing protein [Sutcliffiella horikoshii]TYS63580.1 VWA domain-containing protein [Sutcliffiella horikoshii]